MTNLLTKCEFQNLHEGFNKQDQHGTTKGGMDIIDDLPTWQKHLEGVTFLCETIHELSRKKLNGGIFKLGFEPMIKCPFLPPTNHGNKSILIFAVFMDQSICLWG